MLTDTKARRYVAGTYTSASQTCRIRGCGQKARFWLREVGTTWKLPFCAEHIGTARERFGVTEPTKEAKKRFRYTPTRWGAR